MCRPASSKTRNWWPAAAPATCMQAEDLHGWEATFKKCRYPVSYQYENKSRHHGLWPAGPRRHLPMPRGYVNWRHLPGGGEATRARGADATERPQRSLRATGIQSRRPVEGLQPREPGNRGRNGLSFRLVGARGEAVRLG